MAEEQTITIEVDGRKLKARPGQMLIVYSIAALLF
jgi:chaperone required for assembly of F1-ATPase